MEQADAYVGISLLAALRLRSGWTDVTVATMVLTVSVRTVVVRSVVVASTVTTRVELVVMICVTVVGTVSVVGTVVLEVRVSDAVTVTVLPADDGSEPPCTSTRLEGLSLLGCLRS